MNEIAILGASGHGKVVAEIAELVGWGKVTFFDDAYPGKCNNANWKVAGNTDDLIAELAGYDGVFVAIGENKTRYSKQRILEKSGANIVSLVHPKAVVSEYVDLGRGTVVMANAVVNPYSKIGESCIINTSSSVDHDCTLLEAVHIAPGAHLAGGVHVGFATFVGLGTKIIQEISIGSNVVVGAGAVVVNDVMGNSIVVGVPAKPLKKSGADKCFDC